MRTINLKHLMTALATIATAPVLAQEEQPVPTASDYMVAPAKTDGHLIFSTTDEGKKLPIVWGLDTAWPSQDNMTRGVAFIGKDCLGTARASFQPNDLVDENGELSTRQKRALNNRLNIIKTSGVKDIVLNCDHEVLDANNYYGKPAEWARLIEATVKYCQSKGYNVVTVSPFNEPDFASWGEGSLQDFYNIAKILKSNPLFDNIRISGGNTLNCDEALRWYNGLKEYLDEGNTHQLAGSFDNYAKFFTQVRADGKYASADELHNVMEAIVGVEYGMQTGIWWGYDGLARGEFCRASFGERLAYAEDRPHWTAAAVYRSPEGKVQAFGGTSERQANNSSYRFSVKDREVYFDGYGPQREYIMELPGGTGYQQGQTNAERVVNITWGEDVQPAPINGRYIIMNKNSQKVISVQGGGTADATNICQNSDKGHNYQQWDIKPVSNRIGGDFSYYGITCARDGKYLDILNWGTNSGANIILYGGGFGANEQWYFQYAGNGDYYIRSRHSNMCLEVASGSKTENANVMQASFNGEDKQKWRIIPVGAACELNAPAAPQQLTATPQTASVLLSWNENTEEDLAGYMVLRAEATETAEAEWNTIGRKIQGTTFIDNTARAGSKYLYKIKAIDMSDNISEASGIIEGSTSDEKGIIAHYEFEQNTKDLSANHANASTCGKVSFVAGQSGERCISLDGSTEYIQMPYAVAHNDELTISSWVKWRGGSKLQHIFDFGNGTDRYMYLTPNSGTTMRFAINNGEEEQTLDCTRLGTYKWVHIALTIGSDEVCIYVNGEKAASTSEITIKPSDLSPSFCYLGKSQSSTDPMYKGYIDDFRIYNYALSADAIKTMYDEATAISDIQAESEIISTEYFSPSGMKLSQPQNGINIIRIRKANGTTETKKIIW